MSIIWPPGSSNPHQSSCIGAPEATAVAVVETPVQCHIRVMLQAHITFLRPFLQTLLHCTLPARHFSGFGSEFPAIDRNGASLETGATGSARVRREGLEHAASSEYEDDQEQEPGQRDVLSAAVVATKVTARLVAAAPAPASAAVAASKLEDIPVVPRAAAPHDPSPPSPSLAATTDSSPTPQPATPTPPQVARVPLQQPPAGHQHKNLSSASQSDPAIAEHGLPLSRPPYLAAGVLPFCVLGGDLLFLLGQQLRFRSRVRRPSLSEPRGGSTSVGGGCGAGREGGGARAIGSGPPAAPSCETNSRDGASADGGKSRRGKSKPTEALADAPPAPAVAVECASVGQTPPSGGVEEGQGKETVPAGLLWSDFGGVREAGDADAKETASREFAEESFGMFHGVRLESDSVSRSQVRLRSSRQRVGYVPRASVAARVAAAVSTTRP